MEQVLRELSLRRRLAVEKDERGEEGAVSCTAEGEPAVHRARGEGRGPGGTEKEWREQQNSNYLMTCMQVAVC